VTYKLLRRHACQLGEWMLPAALVIVAMSVILAMTAVIMIFVAVVAMMIIPVIAWSVFSIIAMLFLVAWNVLVVIPLVLHKIDALAASVVLVAVLAPVFCMA
jgi:hypothetical protein